MKKLNANTATELINKVVKARTCTGCGLCVGLDTTGKSKMIHTSDGPRPQLTDESLVPGGNIQGLCRISIRLSTTLSRLLRSLS